MPRRRLESRISRRAFLTTAASGALGAAIDPRVRAADGSAEVLYNGIRLAAPWPPRLRSLSQQPTPPPYLLDPPGVIPIDLGRQLFVDDFLIEATSLTRRFHQAEYYSNNPILRPTTAWERFDANAERVGQLQSPTAMVFSDGVFYDPADRVYKMWYMGGYGGGTCYATSNDGIEWTRPMLDVKRGTNYVSDIGLRDSTTIWLDLETADRARRYKMSVYRETLLALLSSPDGIHWRQEAQTPIVGDRSTIFYNPFRKKWVYSLRDTELGGMGRFRRYREHDDLFRGASWRPDEAVLWTRADAADPPRADYGIKPELYNVDAVAYESVMLGLFSIWRGERPDREKPNDVCIGFSRDGFHWSREERRPFIPVSEHVGDWNWSNIQSAGGCCLIVGDKLHFYVSGRSGYPGTQLPGRCSTGLVTLRRDGFASMDVPAESAGPRLVNRDLGPGVLVTRPVRFSGEHLFVNADLGKGELRVAVADRAGRALPGFEFDSCVPVRGDGTRLPVAWKAASLSRVAGQPVRLRFQLTDGRIYAFWVTASESGASGGYVAAGGPAFRSPRDL
jgi:hypothetical protein